MNRFEFWGGDIAHKNRFSHDELEALEAAFEDCYPEGVDETLCEWLDIDFEEWVERPDDYWMNHDE